MADVSFTLARKDLTTELGKLVHDLSCSNPDECSSMKLPTWRDITKKQKKGEKK